MQKAASSTFNSNSCTALFLETPSHLSTQKCSILFVVVVTWTIQKALCLSLDLIKIIFIASSRISKMKLASFICWFVFVCSEECIDYYVLLIAVLPTIILSHLQILTWWKRQMMFSIVKNIVLPLWAPWKDLGNSQSCIRIEVHCSILPLCWHSHNR